MSRHDSMPAELARQRVAGNGRLGVRLRDGRTRTVTLFQEGAAKIRLPRAPGGGYEAALINTAGGLTGGDRLSWAFVVEEGASATLSTPAAEKVYRSAGGRAEVGVTASVAAGGRLSWLPQETILFDRSALARRLDFDLAEGASALIVESVVFGRTAHGETVNLVDFRDRWRVRAGGRLVHAEDFALSGNAAGQLARAAIAGGNKAVATVLLVADDAEKHVSAARDVIGPAGGASFWSVAGTGKFLARLYAEDGYALRKCLMPLLAELNGRAGLPKLWSI